MFLDGGLKALRRRRFRHEMPFILSCCLTIPRIDSTDKSLKYFTPGWPPMIKISIVPDTNVFISSLTVVEVILQHEFPWLCTLNISRTVLDELDSMKGSKQAARKAIKYIQSIALSLKVEIEGRIDDRKIDVEIECKESVKEKSNDDRILNYLFKLENPVLVTNDVSFSLRCQSFNIYVVSARENRADVVISRILSCFGVSEQGGEPTAGQVRETANGPGAAGISPLQDISNIENFKQEFKNLIEPIICQILLSEVGEGYRVLLTGPLTLEYYLEFMAGHYGLFKSYFPKNCCPVIEKFLAALRNRNMRQVSLNAKVLLVAFGFLPTDDQQAADKGNRG